MVSLLKIQPKSGTHKQRQFVLLVELLKFLQKVSIIPKNLRVWTWNFWLGVFHIGQKTELRLVVLDYRLANPLGCQKLAPKRL